MHWAQVQIGHNFFLPEQVARVNRLCEQSGAKIVVTSTWRLEFSLRAFQPIFGNQIIDATPLVRRIPAGIPMRWLEVEMYLRDREDIGQYVIIDDQAGLFPPKLPQLVITDPASGFLEKNLELALAILRG